jgi:hypothetical protein
LEKDRKIDWSATEKIECYVDVLMASPDKDTLLKHCGSETCLNKWREDMYNKCNGLCPEVDYAEEGIADFPKWGSAAVGGAYGGDDAKCTAPHPEGGKWAAGTEDLPCIDRISELIDKMGNHGRRAEDFENTYDYKTDGSADEDVTAEGEHSVTTKHRAGDLEEEKRCTSHLDLDWQKPPCCQPCEVRPSPPCEGETRYDDPVSGFIEAAEGASYSFTPQCGKVQHCADENARRPSYMWLSYGKYGLLDGTEICDFVHDKCYEASGEHTFLYAYNLCQCAECPEGSQLPCPHCTVAKACGATPYDYSKHKTVAKCEDRDDENRDGTRTLTEVVRSHEGDLAHVGHNGNQDGRQLGEENAYDASHNKIDGKEQAGWEKGAESEDE